MVEKAPSAAPKLFLRRAEAAAYVHGRYGFPCSKGWLAKLATTGGGPTYRKAGKFPIYDVDDLDSWAQNRISEPLRSTSVLAE